MRQAMIDGDYLRSLLESERDLDRRRTEIACCECPDPALMDHVSDRCHRADRRIRILQDEKPRS